MDLLYEDFKCMVLICLKKWDHEQRTKGNQKMIYEQNKNIKPLTIYEQIQQSYRILNQYAKLSCISIQ